MTRYILLFIYVFIIIANSLCQNITVSGYVYNSINNEKIIDTYIFELNSKTGGVSNDYGFFSISIKKSNNLSELVFSNIAYQSDTIIIQATKDTLIHIKLVPGQTLQEVEISGKQTIPIEKRNEISVLSIPMKQIDILPSFGGERDIIKAYQLMPGVQSGNEGSSGLFIRGGSSDQNLILIDDTPIYYVNHLGGFVSVFNNDAISSTKLIKGGFPARYGGRLSSALDVRMKEGNNKKFGGNASLGLLSGKIMIEGPIEKDTSSFLVSYRRFLYDIFMRPITKIITKNTSSGYYFQDFNLKVNHMFSAKDRLYFSIYFGDDKMMLNFNENDNNIINEAKHIKKWGNFLTALRWNHLFNNKMFGNFIFSFTRYRFNMEMNSRFTNSDNVHENHHSFFSGIYDLSFKPNFEYYLSPKYKMRFGILSTYHIFKPGITSFNSKTNQTEIINKLVSEIEIYALENAGYFENEIKLSDKLNTNLGIRYSTYFVNEKLFSFFEPRFLINYLITENHSIKASFSKMHQNVHLLSNSGVGMPVDFWMPSTEIVHPSKSFQYTIGYAGTFKKNLEFSIEAFYKEMKNLTTLKEGESYFGTNKTWNDKIETDGYGTVYGIDFLLQKKIGFITGWIGYTWMKNYRSFENINNGKEYPYKYDRRHDFSIVINYKLNENIDYSLTWVYGTGQALTLPVAKYYIPMIFPGSSNLENFYMEEIYIYTDKNAFRAKAYHRLDIGINFRKSKKWGERIWNISIYNLYNRKNPYSYYFSSVDTHTSSGNQEKMSLFQQSLFPIIPSVSYSIKF